jgi:hypothetical protein
MHGKMLHCNAATLDRGVGETYQSDIQVGRQ